MHTSWLEKQPAYFCGNKTPPADQSVRQGTRTLKLIKNPGIDLSRHFFARLRLSQRALAALRALRLLLLPPTLPIAHAPACRNQSSERTLAVGTVGHCLRLGA